VPTDTKHWHRLHPSSLVFQFTASIRQFIVPGLAVLVFGASNDWAKWELYLMPIVVLVMVAQIMRYWTLRYRFDAGELVVKHGVFSRNERHVPFDRIQNIDLIQNPLHRLLRVAEVRLQTASGSEPEAVLRVLSMQAVELMRARVRAGRTESRAVPDPTQTDRSDSTQATPRRVIVKLGLGELVRLGLVANRGLVFVAAAMGAMYQFNLFDQLDIGGVFSNGKKLLHAADLGIWVIVIGVLIAVLLGAMLLALMSVAWAILRFYGFTLEQVGDDHDEDAIGFRVSSGLFTRRLATIPAKRIQFISVRQGPVERLFGRVSIRIETAGAAGDDGEHSHYSRWFVPILPEADAARVIALVQPGLCFERSQSDKPMQDEVLCKESTPTWQMLSKRARWRMTKRALRLWLIITIVVSVVAWPYGLAVAILPVLAVWYERRAWSRLAYAVTSKCVLFKSGVFTRITSAARIEKIQAVSLSETLFDRRYGMATLRIDTAGAGPAGHRIHVPYLDRQTADALALGLAHGAESARFEW
jgi:putative membrane protein